ncbi:DUF819 domain-containing protein [Bacillus aquiflavi]|uniref:DUF819 domain-containing protein n=1 Tax=Bacillus aquiflavi TaxID=2672567 RepID=A0A6B3VWP0_9BACI|nr:DUF819 family protein [Bacillus aquiflavi]MBA4536367.1 DUF819 domain-containing protein [Bacillus aquiflavi]NEY80735.1 DUF819 domain-containing protein [Bacillus aquiflavi]UAC48061.1 DUF819 family protein [Bacillus aquiflavi]
MIEDGFLYFSVLIALTAIIAWLEKRTGWKFFKYVPGIVLIYIGAALLKTFGVFGETDSITDTSKQIRGTLLPAMIVLMLLHCDMRKLVKLGPKMLLGYATAVISIVVGFTLTFAIFQSYYAPESWKAFGALAGSWTGGSANMVAIQGILDVPETIFGYMLVMDTVNYSVWVLFMFWLVPFAAKFNKWTGASSDHLAQVKLDLQLDNQHKEKQMSFPELMALIGIGIFVSGTATAIGNKLPEIGDVINATTWTISIASVVGLILAMTKVARIPGSMDVANVMLYIIVALIASQADFSQLFQVPIYIISGFMIMLFHGLVMLLLAKLFKLDLFTLGVASLANIGGMASAPLLASAYNRALIPVGVLMALAGSFLGTYLGLITAKILSLL